MKSERMSVIMNVSPKKPINNIIFDILLNEKPQL